MQPRPLDAVVVVEVANRGEEASKEEAETSVVDPGSVVVGSQQLAAMATLHVLVEVVAGLVLRKTRLCGCTL